VIVSPLHHDHIAIHAQVASRIACVVRIQPSVLIKPFDPRVKASFS
jgi:hypothetical protein